MTIPVGKNLSHYLKRVMREKKLSRFDVARNSGGEIAASYIGRMIAGSVTNLSVEKIVALAAGLDVDPYEIFAASVDRPPRDGKGRFIIDLSTFGDIVQRLAGDGEMLEILQHCLNMSDRDRQALLTTLRSADGFRPKSSKEKRG
ncbi:MAG TPA: helix-turn-helix transcriptional regulator [Blastocatellia bacterium]|nr:helix-turn-helix transcriptional regulator [Blastocatellia bacterium]